MGSKYSGFDLVGSGSMDFVSFGLVAVSSMDSLLGQAARGSLVDDIPSSFLKKSLNHLSSGVKTCI